MKSSIRAVVKLIVCKILYYSGLLSVYLFILKKRTGEFPAVIINYHSFVKKLDTCIEIHPTVTHKIKDFEREIKFLKRHFDIVSLDTIVSHLKAGKKFPRPTVSITVDDGFKDNYDLLFPILKKYGVTVTIFLTTGVIGTKERLWVNKLESMFLTTVRTSIRLNGIFRGVNFQIGTLEERRSVYLQVVRRLKNIEIKERDEYLKVIEKRLGVPEYDVPHMLNWDQVREMQQNGIHFGAHTVNHPILTSVSLEDGKKEILESKVKIEQELGRPIKHFAYPNGRPQDFDEDLRDYCKDIGFDSVSSCIYGHNDNKEDIWALKRIGSEIPLSLYAFNILRAFRTKESHG